MKRLMAITFILLAAFSVRADESVTVVLAGDVLHNQRVKTVAAKIGEEDQALYGTLFEQIRPIVERADISFANLETPVSAAEPVKPVPFVFNAPYDLLKGLKLTGFDVLSIANNHSLDQKMSGFSETISAVEKAGLTALGGALSREKAIAGHVVNIRGLRVGFLAFTSLLNGGVERANTIPSPYLAISDRGRDLFEAVDSIKKRADIVILSLHWGVEYEDQPRSWQIKQAAELHERGVDVIVGHHPHVLQPVKWYIAKDGRRCLTLYSIGNLISNQSRDYRHLTSEMKDGRTRDGALIELHLSMKGVEAFRPYPLWTDNWAGAEEGIRTVRISEELSRLNSELGRLKPSPQRTFLLERRSLLTDRSKMIFKSLGLGADARAPASTNR